MIDTDKYEGHTPAPWHIENEENDGMRLFICSKDATILWQCETTHTDALLVADAPLLLEAYKRLREKNESYLATLSEEANTIDEWCAEVERLREENESLRLHITGQPSEEWMLFTFEGMQRLHVKHDSSLAEVKSLTKTLELIGKNMPYDSWMHTLIKDVIGFEKWQAKEMREMASEGDEE